MASLIKNQILKHLAKFTKNLSPDKIQISTLKGEGALSNLELNSELLMEIMELPLWLRLTKAVCNKVQVKIQWTKLKSEPIRLYLDEIIVEMETVAELRKPPEESAMSGGMPQMASGGKYGFSDRVIDGIFLSVNSIHVRLKSEAFNASIQLNRLHVQSVNPKWQPCDLRSTCLRDRNRGEILLFKLIDWQTIRIEACASNVADSVKLTPIRLITNQGKVRITMKKRMSDSSLVSSRLMLIMDDLLWVLTDLQLKAAILFANSVSKYIEKSSKYSKMKAGEKVQKSTIPAMAYKQQQSAPGGRNSQQQLHSTAAGFFDRLDVIETSFHLIISRLDLHLCDDFSPATAEKHNTRIKDGAMQMTLMKMLLDYYPYHLAGGDRSHWFRYVESGNTREQWTTKLYTEFKQRIRAAKSSLDASRPRSSSEPEVLLSPGAGLVGGSATAAGPGGAAGPPLRSPAPQGSVTSQPSVANQVSQPQIRMRQPRLLESVAVFRMDDFVVYCVSTGDSKRATPQKLLSSDKKQLYLPADTNAVHLEFSEYYFPEGMTFPVPSKYLYSSLAPLRVFVDFPTLMWMNSYFVNLYKDISIPIPEASKEHVDVRFEAIMPKVVVPAADTSDDSKPAHPDRPTALQLQVAKVVVSNTRSEPGMGVAELRASWRHVLTRGSMFAGDDFPRADHDLQDLPSCWSEFLAVANLLRLNIVPSTEDGNAPDAGLETLRTNSLKQLADEDIWCVSLNQVWADFTGIKSCRGGRLPFLDAFSSTLWLCSPRPNLFTAGETLFPPEIPSATPPAHDRLLPNGFTDDVDAAPLAHPDATTPDVAAIFVCDERLSVQLDHFQFLFLVRLADAAADAQKQVESDVERITGHSPHEDAKTLSLVSLLPPVDVFFVHPPVVVNGGIDADMTPLPPPAPGANRSRAATDVATPDLVKTPDAMSSEVEGATNLGFKDSPRFFHGSNSPTVSASSSPAADRRPTRADKRDAGGGGSERNSVVQVEGQVELPATPTLSSHSLTSLISPPSGLSAPVPENIIEEAHEMGDGDSPRTCHAFPTDAVSAPDSSSKRLPPPITPPVSLKTQSDFTPLPSHSHDNNSSTPTRHSPSANSTGRSSTGSASLPRLSSSRPSATPPLTLPLGSSVTPPATPTSTTKRTPRATTNSKNDDKRNSVASLPDAVGDTLARSRRTLTSAVANPLDSAIELSNKSGKVLDSALTKSTSAFTKGFFSVGTDLNKGFTTVGSSINKFGTTLKNNTVGKITDDDQEDSWTEVSSNHSDSDDSDLVIIGADDLVSVGNSSDIGDAFGSLDPLEDLAGAADAVEEGAEARDDADADRESVSSATTTSARNRERVSVAALTLPGGSQLCLQVQPAGGLALKAMLTTPRLAAVKNLGFDEFQSKFAAAGKKKAEAETSDGKKDTQSFPVFLRFDAGPPADALVPGSADVGVVRVDVSNLAISLPVSMATAFADLFEDEIIPPPMPLEVNVKGIAFKMVPDLPPLHLTSPGPIELDFFVASTRLLRGLDGVFRVNFEGNAHSAPTFAGATSEALMREKLENANLKQKVVRLATEMEVLKRLRKMESRGGSPTKEMEMVGDLSSSTSSKKEHRKLSRLLPNDLLLKGAASSGSSGAQTPPPSPSPLPPPGDKDDQLRLKIDELMEENSSLKTVLKDALGRLAAAEDAAAEQRYVAEKQQHQEKPTIMEEEEEAGSLRKENELLNVKLGESKDEITQLNQEKNSLLATLQLLQEELLRSEHMRGRASTTS